ncbi:MAG: branched-chain amino acid ABC transporter substrate-binding protein [Gammaproteobacteria bacterium]|nr:branched-chain amino acid ABC transporter substrate-binding protein [Gammaproteobacteria bacterium]
MKTAPTHLNGITVAVLLTAGLTTGCQQKVDDSVVRIGSVAPLTGMQAHYGKDNDNGARLAVEELNARGVVIGGKKVTIEVLSEDDQADPRTATIVAQKLVDKQIKGVIGHMNSGASIPASKIYHDARIPQISPSATAISYTAQGFDTAFRVMTNDREQGKVVGEYAVKKLGAKAVAIIDDRTAYGQGLADEVEKTVLLAGGKIASRQFTTDHATDFTAILTAIKATHPDLVFYGGMDPQGAPLVKQMRNLGIQAQYLGSDGIKTLEFLSLAGKDGDGTIASMPGLPLDKMPGGKTFSDKFTAHYGPIQVYAPYAYDAMNVMVAAMVRAGSTDPAKYLAELHTIHYSGVTGDIAFDHNGDIKAAAITLYQAKNGKWEFLETITSNGEAK